MYDWARYSDTQYDQEAFMINATGKARAYSWFRCFMEGCQSLEDNLRKKSPAVEAVSHCNILYIMPNTVRRSLHNLF